MNPLTLIMAAFFGLIGLSLIFVIGRTLLESAFGNPRGWSERWRFNRKEKLLNMANEFERQELTERAYPLLREAFFLDQIKFSNGLIDRVTNHNLSILGHLVVIGERLSRHFDNLALIEGLLVSRSELMKAYYDAIQTRRKLQTRGKTQGREAPDWAMNEFAKKIAELREKLDANKRALAGQINELFGSLSKMPHSSDLTYH